MVDPELVPTWVSACAAVGTFLVALGATIAAFVQVSQAKTLREEQAQPFVVVDFQPSAGGEGVLMDLVIRNSGRTLAKDVTVEFTPPLVSTLDDQNYRLADTYILKHGIASMPPGREYRMLFDRMPDRYEQDDLPRQYTATTCYSSTRKKNEPLVQTLDLDVFYGSRYVAVHGLHHIAKTLRAVAKNQGIHSF